MAEAVSHTDSSTLALDAGARVRTLLGLTGDPFSPDGLGGFFFVGGQRRYLVQQAVHQLCFGARTTLLIGESGTGKSRLLTEIARDLTALADLCRVDATVMTDAVSLRAAVVVALGLRSDAATDEVAFIAALAALRPLESEPLPVVLLVDDAHLLAPPVLAACAQLVEAADGRLRLLLTGDRSLLLHWCDAPGCAEPGSPAVARIDLEPLEQRESVDYLRTRLQAAGLRGALPLGAAGERQLYRLSGGSLAAIQSVAPDLLLAALEPAARQAGGHGARGSGWLAARRSRVVLGGAVALLAVIVLLAALPGSDNEAAPTQRASVSVDVAPAGRERVPLVLSWGQSPAADGEAARAAAAVPGTASGQEGTGPDDRPAAVGATSAGTVADRTTAAVALPPPPQSPAAAPVAPAAAPLPGSAAGTGPAGAPSVALSDDEQALLAMDESAYVVQLMGARSLPQLKQSVVDAGVGGRVYYLETRLAGKPWFVALQGPYQQSATPAAIAALPAPVRSAKPWSRRLAAVHADLRSDQR